MESSNVETADAVEQGRWRSRRRESSIKRLHAQRTFDAEQIDLNEKL